MAIPRWCPETIEFRHAGGAPGLITIVAWFVRMSGTAAGWRFGRVRKFCACVGARVSNMLPKTPRGLPYLGYGSDVRTRSLYLRPASFSRVDLADQARVSLP